jgi:putative N6-adenine-specific DNA methylase
MMKVNLWSRVGNKVYMVLEESPRANNFDALYDLTYSIDWKKYIPKNAPVLVKATSIKSQLSSTPAIQKIVKKAIVDKITNKSGQYLMEDREKEGFEVFTFFHDDTCYILANSSGETLYKRGYKKDT